MEEKINVAKIVVNESNELTDLVRDIHKSKAERIILTFTERTDILISPINLKVLQETAEREGKLLVAQIIQNPTGMRNAKVAGIKTIDTPTSPSEYDWEEALSMLQNRKKEKVVKKKELKEEVIIEDEKEKFEEKVNSKLEQRGEKGEYVDRRGIKPPSPFIAIDSDLPKTPSLKPRRLLSSNDFPMATPVKSKGPKVNILNYFKGINKKKLLKISLFSIVPLLLLGGVGFFLYNQFVPFVKIKLYVESKPVEIEYILIGDEAIEEIDFENLKIPIKLEEATQSLSDSVTATGTAIRGEKATGTVIMTYTLGSGCPSDSQKITLSAGHIISTINYSFKLLSGVELEPCNDMSDPIQVEAIEIGDQYNVEDGEFFSVQGYSKDVLYAMNSAAFTGGTKEEYTVLSQQDVDNAVEQLSTTAIEEVKSDLRDIADDDWEIIEDTILSAVDPKSIKTDIAIGAEADTANLDLTIKGTATFYSATGLDEKLNELLRLKAEEENLFETDDELELVLGDDLEKSITVEDSEKGVVKIKIVASSSIKPDVDKTEIENKLKGLSWEEGREYLNTLNYAERKPDITFNPMTYPEFLKRFPDRRGGSIITIIPVNVVE